MIGRGGLLGSAVAQRLGQPPGPTGVRWDEPDTAERQVHDLAVQLAGSPSPRPWWALWCAGAGFVGADEGGLGLESRYLDAFLDGLRGHATHGVVLLASSAGALHAGAPGPVDESSPPTPISGYGREKLDQEERLRAWCAAEGGRGVIARIANVYGPGQNLGKPQGIISHLVRASLLAEPLTIFVPLDTSRDYLFAADAARLVEATVQRAEDVLAPGACVVKLLASRRQSTLGAIVAELTRIRKRRPPLIFSSRPATTLQPRALVFDSGVWPDLDAWPTTPLPEGIAAVVRSQTALLGRGALR